MTKQTPKAKKFNAAGKPDTSAFDVALAETANLLKAHGHEPPKDLADVMRQLNKLDLSAVLKP